MAGNHWLSQYLSNSCMELPLTEASEDIPKGTWGLNLREKKKKKIFLLQYFL